jgi:hypothetical protein
MAVKKFKDIIDYKGYRINSKDRKIFEEGNLQSFFGFGDKDAIEFIVYDINDNQLPQKDDKLIRYVTLSTENIRDYFLVAEGTLFEKNQFPSEYFIDVERLLREAGYDNGIFKTQITLLNKRVGSEQPQDKLWVSEISPSRTEVRLFPIKNSGFTNTELEKRYSMFIQNQQFRDDLINSAFVFLDKITPTSISDFIRNKYSREWFDKFRAEYKITDFESFIAKIHTKFIESAGYYFTNRNSDIRSNSYGKPLTTRPKLDLSENEIKESCKLLLAKSVDFYLTQLDVKRDVTQRVGLEESLDDVGKVMQRYETDILIDTQSPERKIVTIEKQVIDEKSLFFEKEKEKEKQPTDPVADPVTQPLPDPPVETPVGDPPYEPPKGPKVGEYGAMTQAEIDQEKLNNALLEDGVYRGYGDMRQIAVRDRDQNRAVE